MADLIADATDPAPHPEETEEKNNEQSPCWRPAHSGRVGSRGPSGCVIWPEQRFSLLNAVYSFSSCHACFPGLVPWRRKQIILG